MLTRRGLAGRTGCYVPRRYWQVTVRPLHCWRQEGQGCGEGGEGTPRGQAFSIWLVSATWSRPHQAGQTVTPGRCAWMVRTIEIELAACCASLRAVWRGCHDGWTAC